MGKISVKIKDDKKESKAKVQSVISATEIIQPVAERYAELKDKVAELKKNPIYTQFSEAETELRELVDTHFDKDDKPEFYTKKGLVKVGAVPERREITDVQKLYDLVGHDTFMQMASVALKDVDMYIAPAEQKEFITKMRKGSRSLSVK